MKEVNVYEHFMDKNLLWFLQIHLHLTETAPAKSGLKREKPETKQNEAEIWLRFSQLVAPVKNMREVFFLHPVTEKKISRFFKIHFHLPKILPRKKLVKLTKITVLSFGGGWFLRGKWYVGPP
jgi:hypothetical protein